MTAPSRFSLSGKKILVTGAAGHLGQVLCASLLADNSTVFAVDVDEERLKSMLQELDPTGKNFVPLAFDLSDERQRVAMVSSVAEKTESLDGAVFAAAFVGTALIPGWAVDFADQEISSWRMAMELNLAAPFHLAQLAEPLLSSGDNPSIVNIGSIYGSVGPDKNLYAGVGFRNPAAYAASKGGLLQLTRWLAAELSPTIRVNIVSPGGLARAQPQKFQKRYSAKTLLGRMGTEEDIVGPILALLSPASSYITGQEILVDGGFTVT